MKALLLAAGVGSRLRPLTNSVPKCLAPVMGRPLLGYWLDMLFAAGIERVLINTHHLAGSVHQFLETSPWSARVDIVHEPALLGTAGTMRDNQGWLNGETFLLAHADNLTLFDVRGFCSAHQSRPPNCLLTMMTFETDTPQSCGIVETDALRRVVAFHEKVSNPPGRQANAAVYLMEPDVLELIPGTKGIPADLSTQVIPKLTGRIFTWPNLGYHRDIGTPASLAQAQLEFPSALTAWERKLKDGWSP